MYKHMTAHLLFENTECELHCSIIITSIFSRQFKISKSVIQINTFLSTFVIIVYVFTFVMSIKHTCYIY